MYIIDVKRPDGKVNQYSSAAQSCFGLYIECAEVHASKEGSYAAQDTLDKCCEQTQIHAEHARQDHESDMHST